MIKTVNCVWIGERVSLMEKLSIVLAQKAGFEVVVWTDSHLDLPKDTLTKSIPSNVIKPTRFRGIPHEMLPNGGIGSYSHWSDYFAFTTLCKEGGYWMQLDFAILHPIEIGEDYCFTSFGGGISPVFMKIPKNSHYAKHMVTVLEPLIEKGFSEEVWDHSMNLMHKYALEHNVYSNCEFIRDGYFDCGCVPNSPYTTMPINIPKYIHWSNATNNTSKDEPVIGSLYRKLCEDNNLI